MPSRNSGRSSSFRIAGLFGLVSGASVLMLTFALAPARLHAHKGVTSKYTYNEDVYPILRDKCGRCHADGGVTPMSLLKYSIDESGAAAWAESIREMLVSEAMPPWYVDPTGPSVRNSHALTPREMDIVITWATGGTPQGSATHKPVPTSVPVQWTLGAPDQIVQMEQPYTLASGSTQETADLTVPTGLTEARWVRAVDLLPGTPSMVRRATISLDQGPTLAVWEPGDEAIAAPSGAAFRLPAGAKLHLQMVYKKPWQEEQQATSDRSSVGLYFTDEPLSGKSIQSFAVDGTPVSGSAVESSTFSGTMTTGGRVVALRPQVDQPYATVVVEAVVANGRRLPLLKFRSIRPEWPRRYWLTDPVELPAGTKIEVTVQPADPDSGPLIAAVKSPLQIALDLVPQ